MSLFEYRLADEKEVRKIRADFYAVEKRTTINLRKEESVIVEYVFYKDGKDFWRIPTHFVDKIVEVE